MQKGKNTEKITVQKVKAVPFLYGVPVIIILYAIKLSGGTVGHRLFFQPRDYNIPYMSRSVRDAGKYLLQQLQSSHCTLADSVRSFFRSEDGDGSTRNLIKNTKAIP